MKLITGSTTLRQTANDLRCSKLYDLTSARWVLMFKGMPPTLSISEHTCKLSSSNTDRAMFLLPKRACKTAALPPATVLVWVTKTRSTGKRFTRVDLRRNSRLLSLRSMWDKIITLSNCLHLWAVWWKTSRTNWSKSAVSQLVRNALNLDAR